MSNCPGPLEAFQSRKGWGKQEKYAHAQICPAFRSWKSLEPVPGKPGWALRVAHAQSARMYGEICSLLSFF